MLKCYTYLVHCSSFRIERGIMDSQLPFCLACVRCSLTHKEKAVLSVFFLPHTVILLYRRDVLLLKPSQQTPTDRLSSASNCLF